MEFPIVRRHFAPPKTSFWLIKSNSSNRWFWFRKKWKTMPKIMSRKTCIFLKKTWIPYKGARSQALRAITGAHAKNMIPRPNPSWNEENHDVAKNTKKRCFKRSLWTRRTKRADASRDASKIAHNIAAVFHVWRHLCTERHMVRQHLLRGTIATEVESVILRASEKKNSKNYVFEEH